MYIVVWILAASVGASALEAPLPHGTTIFRANYEDPVFDHRDYDFFVDENLPPGQIVGTVQAMDLDPTVPNNKLTYAIVPDDGTFSVDPGSSLITTKRPLDRETKDLHELIAQVSDHGRERSR